MAKNYQQISRPPSGTEEGKVLMNTTTPSIFTGQPVEESVMVASEKELARANEAEHDPRSNFTPLQMLMMVLAVPASSTIYYYSGKYFASSSLSFTQYLMFTAVVALTVTGVYQLYFWVQRNNHFFPTRCLKIWLDDHIPFVPGWVWIYNFMYYFMIGFVIVSITSIEQGVVYLFGGIMLILVQTIFFFLLPCTVPREWREYEVTSLSRRLLRFSQRLDNGRNCWPSAHCAVAMYAGLILSQSIGPLAYLSIGMVVASCLLVKQHQILDAPPGLFLGWMAYEAAQRLLPLGG